MNGIVAIGECMVEFSRPLPGGEAWRLRYAGDTLNTAVYLSRLGETVAYMTAIGDDTQSMAMRAEWEGEGVDTVLVLTAPNRLPGLYLIETDGRGERRFLYWRDHSAARALFSARGINAALAKASHAKLLYLSGITLAIFDEDGRTRLIDLCRAVRKNGGEVAFDPNYRARLWPSAQAAQRAFAMLGPLISIALPTLDDEQQLYGDTHADESARRWMSYGAREVAVKQGQQGAVLFQGHDRQDIPCTPDAAPRDTTGAGDAFNASYLAGRLRGLDGAAAARAGNRLASAVIRQPGAIIPRAVMPSGILPQRDHAA